VSRISPLWIIVFVWAASNLLLFALQGLGLGVGFHVHPLGEDREWIRLMAKHQGLEMCGQFLVDAGKPEPARTLVISSVFAADIPPARRALPFAKARGPLPVYLLVDKISHARLPKFAFAYGVLVLFWNFSGYLEQIMWIPLIAFGLSMLSVY
jgi:hypothetical protein